MHRLDHVSTAVSDLDRARPLQDAVMAARGRALTAAKQPWVVLPPGVPAVDANHDRAAYWPPESRARRAALAG